MNLSINFRPEAESDLQQSYDWYESQQPGLGVKFLSEVELFLDRISDHPRAAPTVHRNIRRQLLHRFPHSIFYILEADAIVVLAVYHGRRAPAEWKDRE